MIKILHTGDLHIGREYKKQEQSDPEVAEVYRRARLDALRNIVHIANDRKCDYVVIAGDLYDKKEISLKLQKEVCGLLVECECPVIVIPGNHDYYDGDNEKLWNKFRDEAGDNTILLTDNKPYEPVDGNVVFYPCICDDRYSESNSLSWLKDYKLRSTEKYNIGIAHGAIEGLSYDQEKRYYYMTRAELEACEMDLWLIGHTHMPYPDQDSIENQHIFNAGTHQQTDIADNSKGTVFIIEIDDADFVKAEKVSTGVIWFAKEELHIAHGDDLKEKISELVKKYDASKTTLRVIISGVAMVEDFNDRYLIYKEFEDDFLKLEIQDEELQQEITMDMINAETVEGSVENKLLKKYFDDPELLNLAFGLIRRCKGER